MPKGRGLLPSSSVGGPSDSSSLSAAPRCLLRAIRAPARRPYRRSYSPPSSSSSSIWWPVAYGSFFKPDAAHPCVEPRAPSSSSSSSSSSAPASASAFSLAPSCRRVGCLGVCCCGCGGSSSVSFSSSSCMPPSFPSPMLKRSSKSFALPIEAAAASGSTDGDGEA